MQFQAFNSCKYVRGNTVIELGVGRKFPKSFILYIYANGILVICAHACIVDRDAAVHLSNFIKFRFGEQIYSKYQISNVDMYMSEFSKRFKMAQRSVFIFKVC